MSSACGAPAANVSRRRARPRRTRRHGRAAQPRQARLRAGHRRRARRRVDGLAHAVGEQHQRVAGLRGAAVALLYATSANAPSMKPPVAAVRSTRPSGAKDVRRVVARVARTRPRPCGCRAPHRSRSRTSTRSISANSASLTGRQAVVRPEAPRAPVARSSVRLTAMKSRRRHAFARDVANGEASR